MYWGTDPFWKAISRGGNAPGQGETVIFEKMLAIGAKDRYYLRFGILSLVCRSILCKSILLPAKRRVGIAHQL